MNRAYCFLLFLGTSIAYLAACGCSGGDPSKDKDGPAKTNPITGALETSKTNVKPDALTRENYLRLEQPTTEAELGQTFGPPQEMYAEDKDSRKYSWISGKTKLTVVVRDGKVTSVSYPGQAEEERRRSAAHQATRTIMDSLRKYALANKNRFPQRLDDLDLTDLGKRHPEVIEPLKRGDVIVPWGKSANRIVWAWWKETPQFGGPYVRFDSQVFSKSSPQEFARLEATALTADTIPADIVAAGKPDRGESATLVGQERKGIGSQGFFTAGNLAPLLVTNPGSLDEVAKHMVRNYWHVEVLRQLENGELIVRWGRDPKKGVYAYPRGFPKVGDPAGWAIYNGQWAPFERIDEAKKAFAE